MDVLSVSSSEEDMKLLDKDILSKLYCIDLLSKDKICKELHITAETLNYNLSYYHLERDTKQVRTKRQKERHTAEYEAKVSHIDIDELRRFYIEENHTYQEVLERYCISGNLLDRIIRDNNLHKDKQQAARLGVQLRYERAGGKDAYDAQVRESQEQTLISNYGSLEAYREHLSDVCKSAWTQELKDKQAIWIKENYHSNPDKLQHAKEARLNTVRSRYGVDNTYALADFTGNSKTNQAFGKLLSENNIEFIPEYSIVVDGKTYRFDFKCGNTLVEINPWPFHNCTFTPNAAPVIDKSYHQRKTQVGVDAGFRVINVWEWDDIDKILSMLSIRPRCYARKCVVKELDRDTAKEFTNKYHLQGYIRDKVRLGLYFQDELVSVMTFGKPRYNKSYQFELLRYCSSYNVVGGAEKLFHYFITQYNPTSIISYCDKSKFTGNVYKSLGFTDIGTSISKHWFNINTHQHILDSSLRMKGFDILLGDKYGYYGKGTSNEELMRAHGFVEIYDAGQTTYSLIRR